MKVFFVTGNKSKFEEAKAVLSGSSIKLDMKKIKLIEPKNENQKEVVLAKAEQAFKKIKKPVIVDDTAIYFRAYDLFPGTLTRYLFKRIGYGGIKSLLHNKTKKAYFQTMLCYRSKKSCVVFSGILKGKMSDKPKGTTNPDWQYNNVFIPENFSKPLSEIQNSERIKFSHRRKAFAKLLRGLNGGMR